MNSSAKIVIALIIGLVIGGVFGSTYSYQNGYAQAQADVRARLERAGIIPARPAVMQSVSGRVAAISGTTLMLAVTAPFDPTQDAQEAATYTIQTNSGTTFTSRALNMKAAPKAGQPFNPFIEAKSSLADIKVGDSVIVDAGQAIVGTTLNAKSVTVVK